jgi:hypothetical protein
MHDVTAENGMHDVTDVRPPDFGSDPPSYVQQADPTQNLSSSAGQADPGDPSARKEQNDPLVILRCAYEGSSMDPITIMQDHYGSGNFTLENVRGSISRKFSIAPEAIYLKYLDTFGGNTAMLSQRDFETAWKLALRNSASGVDAIINVAVSTNMVDNQSMLVEPITPGDLAEINISSREQQADPSATQPASNPKQSAAPPSAQQADSAGTASERTATQTTSTRVFLSHAWGLDKLGRDNHVRVGKINESLKKQGIGTWFDAQGDMRGNTMQAMTNGIDQCQHVAVFVTRSYIEKCKKESNDNCKLEFEYAYNRKTVARIIVVVMETDCAAPASWDGPVGAALASQLYINCSGDGDDDLQRAADELGGRLEELQRQEAS